MAMENELMYQHTNSYIDKFNYFNKKNQKKII